MVAAKTDLCSSASYKKPARFKVIIKDRINGSTLYSIDQYLGLVENEGLNLTQVNVKTGMDIAGECTLSFFDHRRLVDLKKVGNGNIVIVQLAKDDPADFVNVFYGFCNDMVPIRSGGTSLKWQMHSWGSQIIFNEILCNYTRAAKKRSLLDPRPQIDDVAMRGWKLYRDFVTKRDVPIYGDFSIAEIGGMTTNGISDKVKAFIGGIDAKIQYASTIHRTLIDAVGAIGGVDANNDIFYRYPTRVHSGITVKAPVSKADADSDYGALTSHVIGPYTAPRSTNLDDFANIITGRATIARNFLNGTPGDDGEDNLVFQALAQRFIPSSGVFDDIALWLKKIGEPTSSKNRVNGAILLDQDFRPSSKRVAEFSISLDAIDDDFKAIYPTNLNITSKKIDINKAHWIVLFERSGHHSGDSDPDNTIAWGTNGDTTTPGQYSAIAHGGDKDADLSHLWVVFPAGPTFGYATFQVKRRQSFAVDPLSVDKFGPKMVPMDSTFIDDDFTLNKFLHIELQERAKPKILFPPIVCTIPNNKVFREGEMVTFVDENNPMFTLSKYQQGLISQVEYNWDIADFSQPNTPLGIRTCRILFTGRYDWISEYLAE